MMNSGLSASDVALLSGSNNRGSNDGAWGGDGAWWIIILFLFVFCGWGNGGWGSFGGNGGGGINSPAGQGALTRGDLCMDMNFAELKSAAQNGVDATNLGFANLNSTICQQQYDTAQMINGLQGAMQNGFNSANVVALQNQNALQAQIAQCCCENREGQSQIRYDMATNACATQNTIQNATRDIIDNQNANSREILDYLCQDKISTLQSENQALRLSASQQAQNAYLIEQLRPTAVPAYLTCSPYASAFGYPYAGNGCGCGYQTANSGCGCC